MKKNFEDLYKAFEDRFRGSRELVKDRLRIYTPLLAQVSRQAEGPTLAIDLGCGRGEWLEMLAEAGLAATGVDMNALMAREATDIGLRVELQDALEYLSTQRDNSITVISAFHMVEHVPTDYLIGLLDECNRVLIDDGLLILETPNPENLSVGTHTFHLDPTHKSPLPPDLLEFLVGQAGFAETAILRLNGAPMIEAGPMERSVHLMFEVARDYACLARKHPPERAKALAAFVETTSQQMPSDIEKVKESIRFVDHSIVGIPELKGTISAMADQLQQLTVGNIALRDTVASLAMRDGEIDRLSKQLEQLAAQIEGIQNSISWRLTAPLRGLLNGFRAVARVPRTKARLFMRHSLLWLRRRPRAVAFVHRVVQFAPPLERRLLAIARASSDFIITDTGWALEPDPVILRAWSKRLKTSTST
ncbi:MULTISPECIES: class I SAM-dependent methyltransferase [unclassified Mesorhizobium]|uniref:class I SAM-dependent methyltransferase n=1 Tax=unclassified Mesorhizobium TaxID=325217 RepID=UPI00112B70B8|nr:MULTISPECIES: class I SAM-dependent methyltransferase [unclassified Mesorhizobium]MCA0023554.1 methyltransferase domain-containing protein [Mesorhizobium sp. B263B1A]TPJ96332.1 class I SAM-dependent methyltransferase [Mesorhizobium sp. B2-5-12]TPK29463.1 class I SAM-dependent methyltransferase [Mesorhizobium sp. B2-5-6]